MSGSMIQQQQVSLLKFVAQVVTRANTEARDRGQRLRLDCSLRATPQQGPSRYGWIVLSPGVMLSSGLRLLPRAISGSMAL